MRSISTLTSQRNAQQTYMLRSLMRCSSCRCSYIGTFDHRKKAFTYRCSGRTHRSVRAGLPSCKSPNIKGPPVNAQIWQRITDV
ncbi:recombinase zinc beta ribbon domain-containing protein [Deinococcus sp. Leaf326]|uniref:recombinase zinc beta ribbon domain-containing protein n=1 Tax=Deinococcus sp. Leaf326 TaxID=1736338 RepID=UPI0009E8C507